MKKIYFLLIGIFSFSGVYAQAIDIPDANFKFWLLYADTDNTIAKDVNGNNINIDLNNNNQIEIAEALNVYTLDLRNKAINDLTGISFFTNLIVLNCQENSITNLDVSTLNHLKGLYCIYSNVTNLNVSGLIYLENLEISQNSLTILNLNNLVSLKHLSCANNNLSAVDLSGLTSLESIILLNNKIKTAQIDGLKKLESIDISTNELTELNLSGLNNLKALNCRENKLLELDLSTTPNLIDLYCSGNDLTDLDLKGLKIEKLFCDGNNLNNLDLKGIETIQYLDCGFNKLTNLDLTDQINLNYLDCTHTSLKELNLNNCTKLYELNCGFNDQLNVLFIKNNVFSYDYSFSPCPNLKFICTTDELIEHYKWIIGTSLDLSNLEINSYCSFVPGGTFYNIQGNSKLDTNNNGCDAFDFNYLNLKLKVTDGIHSGNFISDTSGNYSIPVQEGTHTITPILENPTYFAISPSSISITFPTQSSPFVQDFCITPNGIHNDLEITILPTAPARPGFDATYKIIYKNKGNSVQSGSVSLSFNEAVLDYIIAVPLVNSQVKDKLTWDYTNLQPFESREITVILNVNSPMETPAVNNGDRLSFNALITPVTGDEKPVDNAAALRQSVVSSFDPNDKTCLEGDIITPSLIGEYVNYLIRFENTGTYPAENIVIKDMIDLSKFDISTLVPTKSSHDFVTKISDGNKVEFIFEKINLPFDDANNDGYIAFKIKTLPTLAVGDSFENEANIYFDYNFPILTNKATSTFKTLGTQDFEFSNYFSVYPSPANDILNIGMKNSIEVESIAVYDILGQLVIAVPSAQKVSTIDISKLITGTYFLKMKTNKGASTVKFIKK
ncbi:T9SS type A sorting domain-containing protein [Flavobacterium sp. N3904]|uniref:T9SS type A sorting domain-containing protein n=1 Tax=Flavobacterium sp. N3904 TaxID=2986835 RepID=UPI0022248158|nr:T9SS type A sorting domain-containing protein [Flavobacterium sp. N3904]